MEFMVIAAPRCGTAWAANWLTTDRTSCIHDPLFRYTISELDSVPSRKRLGMSCTGIALWPEFLLQHKARKVILHRDLTEINASLTRIGLTRLPAPWDHALNQIDGMHVHWTELFQKPKPIYEYLLQRDFDEERHALLCGLNVQMDFKADPDPEVAQELLNELISRARTPARS